ncbi:MAG TPA: HlyD family efflux transporter periplasmic adaptor subunit [Bryobacteraceae bacterium]|nr:HlyD family efflux transporter periplasmic adaptor subunit [Bryobacteraceae bacterium]
MPQTHAATIGAEPKAAPGPPPTVQRLVRATGTVQAIRSMSVQTPQITGQGGRLTLTSMAPNGLVVKEGTVVAEFDDTQQRDNALQAKAKFEDLSHQVDQRQAQNRSDGEKRSSDLQKARGDLAKAEIELKKGPLLSEIDRLKNEAKVEDARAHVASLEKSIHFHDLADAAALRVLELQRDRQKVAMERSQRNSERMSVKATIPGMVALENVWRNGSMGHAQEGDQLWSGQPLLKIFDPSDMEVRTQVGEPDGAALVPGARAIVSLDAYPGLVFTARFVSASPVAASALGSPIKTFAATFRLEKPDPHFLPDLSAAVIILPPDAANANSDKVPGGKQ